MPMASREHIVFVFVDQMRADCVSGFGHPVVKTPHLDALLADGVGFRRVVTQSPICVPARMSLFSGRYVHQHGCLNNGAGLWPHSDNLVRAMRHAGCVTACRGKLHLFWRHDNELLMSEPMLKRFGFDDPMETTGKCSAGRMRASAYSEFLRGRGKLDAHWRWLWDQVRGRQIGVSFGPSILDEDEQQDGWIMDRGREMVNAHLGGDRPMFAWIGPEGPHDPFDPPGDWATMYDPADVDMPLLRHSEDEMTREKARSLGVDQADEQTLRRMRALYYGNISFIDHKLGQIVSDLRQRGAYDRTWIVFTADHGEMLGDFCCTSKSVFHRQATEVPLIVKPPIRLTDCPRGRISDALVELIDVGSTFLDMAGATLEGDRGRSLLPLISGARPLNQHRDAVRSQLGSVHMLQTAHRKLIYRTTGPRGIGQGHELKTFFDLDVDPAELRNRLLDAAAEAEAFFAEHEPAFFEATSDHLPPPWHDAAPYPSWGCNPLLDALEHP